MRRLAWVAVGWMALGVGAGVAQTAAKRPMTFADLMAMKRVSDPQVSPSGKWVMFSVTEVSLEKNAKVNHLWVVGMDGKTPERQVTFGDEGQTGGRFSPDGTRVLVISSGGGTEQIWVAAWDEAKGEIGGAGTRGARPLTSLSTEADGAEWSPDSKRIMFVSSVYPECSVKQDGQIQGQTQIPFGNDKKGDNQKEAATWAEEEACDKARLEAAAKDPVKAQVWEHLLYRHWNAFTGERRSHVLVVSATDGEDVRDLTPASAVGDAEVPTFSLGGPLGYAWAPDSKEIAYVANLDAVPAASTNNDVFTLRLDEPGAQAVKISTSLGSDDGPQYSPDGRWLAFRSQARAGYESDKFRLMVFDRGKRMIKELLSKYDDWIDEFTWGSNSNDLYFSSGNYGEESLYRLHILDIKNGLGITRIVGLGEYSALGVPQQGRYGVAVKATVNKPPELVLVDLEMSCAVLDYEPTVGSVNDAKKCGEVMNQVPEEKLTHLNDLPINQLDLNPLNFFWFSGAEGKRVMGFLVRPPSFDEHKMYPVKFLIHGGPQGAWGDAWSYRWNAELMAADGYVVVMVNPRGSTGYGQAFIDGVNGDWGGKAYVDLMRGLDAAEAKFPFIDKTRECALGASYGGYMANWILTHTDRFKCIVTHDGMYDATSAYGATEEMWFNEWEFRRGPATGAAAWDPRPAAPWRYAGLPASQDPFRKWSPSQYIQNAKTPTLVIHSQKDYRLDVSQGFELFTALQRLGVPSKMLYFPDEGHWVLKPRNSELWYKTVGDWCDRWTKTNAYAGK